MNIKNPISGLLCLFIVIMIVCINQIGCEKHHVNGEVFGHVEGTVIDSLTRLPIDSAWISVDPDTSFGPITFTDSTGHYYIGQFPGNYVFYCGKKWYLTKASKEFEIKKNKTTQVNFELVPTKQ